jgi:hypothetical protein
MLFDGRFLLLLDGLNELPNDESRRDVAMGKFLLKSLIQQRSIEFLGIFARDDVCYYWVLFQSLLRLTNFGCIW